MRERACPAPVTPSWWFTTVGAFAFFFLQADAEKARETMSSACPK
jgi:hypothetical protein